jgi:phosphate transport system substrate-binding protein
MLVALLALSLVLAACGSDDNSGGSGDGGGGGTTLNGSGATFPQAFYDAARQSFAESNSDITVNYAGGGSGKGKTDLANEAVQWAGTDSTISEEDLPSFKGGEVLYFPTVAAPITVSYNLSGVEKLQLSGETIAKIFQAEITKWNDPAIAAENEGLELPDTDITIAHRTEASGTTKNFTLFLEASSNGAWKLDTGDTVEWPANSQAGQGNSGVASLVKDTNGAIGYVDFSDATAAELQVASIKNKDGSYIEPSLEGASAALAGATVNENLTYDPLYAPGADSYPITAPTWIIVYAKQTDKAVGDGVKSWLTYILGDAQDMAADVLYAKLPADLLQKATAQLSKLQIPA